MVLVSTLATAEPGTAARRQGDRFSLRLGAWPQRDVSGVLGRIDFQAPEDTVYAATVTEDGTVIPFVELSGMFHIRGAWWAEGGIGWSRRSDVQVAGVREDVPATDSLARILLGDGKVDFLPMFVGARAMHDFGAHPRPHNIYARGGLSLIVASESPNVVHPRVGRRIYSEGTKGGFGFLVGVGGEYYVAPKLGLLVDLQYRYAKLHYTDEADFDLSGFWLAVGMTVMTR
ncbi:MAG: hypothetical protein AB1792_06680 [Candidatus Zixiibacteriota bacterium]